MNELLVQVGNFGFPVIVSMYLLMRIEGKMEALTTSIMQLTTVLKDEK
ncbi:MAG: YvrJ family protein [Cellulosilyticaceae bacterium]